MTKIIAYKAFNADWTCRGFQYEVGKTYTHDGDISLCNSGFHACEYPLDVFGYYPPTGQIAQVELDDVSDKTDGDSKRVAKSITIKASLTIPMLVSAAVEYIVSRCEPAKSESASGYQSAATNTGYQSAATNTGTRSAATNTGTRSAATNTGDQSAATNTGDRSAATNTGDRSAATNTGDQSAATNTGDQSAATNTGDRSAATNTGDQSAATNTGDRSAATNTGDQSAATNTGDRSAATVDKKDSVAACFGLESTAQGGLGSIIVIAWSDGERKRLTTGYVGEDGIEPGVMYRCDEAGKLVKA